MLVDHDVQHRSLTFEAAPGQPLGPKYPHDLDEGQIDGMVDIADQLHGFRLPPRRWLRRLDSRRRLELARRHGLLTTAETAQLQALAKRAHTRYRFGHGDITARNVMGNGPGSPLVLIDWEWAGLYPAGYDHAFLWFSLVDSPGGRDHVERSSPVAEESFLLAALLVLLCHLQWFTPPEFRQKHLATRGLLLYRLGIDNDRRNR